MPAGTQKQSSGRRVSQPLVDEFSSIDDIDEPISTGAWRPVVSAPVTSGSGYNDYSRGNATYSSQRKKKGGKGGKIAVALLIVALLGVVGYGGFQIFKNSYKESINEQLRPTNVEDADAAAAALTPTTARDPFYMMIIGSDARVQPEEGERSDTNIVARVDPTTGTLTMISIPRDTAIMLEGYGTQKFNAAYSYEGVPGAIKAAEGLLGVKISHYVVIDFDGLIYLVDGLGGVDVDVPVTIDDPDAGPVVVPAGMQHLDGQAALTFARSRAYATGDFQRATNQRLLISALLDKCMNLSVTELPGVIEAASQCITTDMSVNMLQDYAYYFMQFDEVTVYSVMVPSTTAMNAGISYVVCDTATLQQVMHAVDAGEDPSVYMADYTVYSSEEAQAAGMPDAIGVDSAALGYEYYDYDNGYEYYYEDYSYNEDGSGYYDYNAY